MVAAIYWSSGTNSSISTSHRALFATLNSSKIRKKACSFCCFFVSSSVASFSFSLFCFSSSAILSAIIFLSWSCCFFSSSIFYFSPSCYNFARPINISTDVGYLPSPTYLMSKSTSFVSIATSVYDSNKPIFRGVGVAARI